MNKYPKIEITKNDLEKIVYFILMKFRGDPLHRQGTSAKRDLIGAYIERWFNKIAETIIFDELLKNKGYNAIPDYFIYANDSEKNAPDILGIELANRTIPFVVYNNGSWVNIENMPRVEVKVVRNDQMLLGVREPQMIDDYYAFIESDLKGNYLTSLFENEIFDDRHFQSLKMSSKFIKRDDDSQIIKHEKVLKTKKIGTMRLLGIYTKDELRKHSVLCGKKISPYYFGGAENKDPRGVNCNEKMELDNLGRFIYKYNDSYTALPISIDTPQNTELTLKKQNKGSVYIHSTKDITINGDKVKSGNIVIHYKNFDRSSSWEENIVSKYILEKYGKDSTEELISKFDDIVSNSQ